MKYNIFLVGFGTVPDVIHFFNCVLMAESVTLATGALVWMTLVPIHFPNPIPWPGTLYSWSCVMAGLVRITLKNVFKLFIIGLELGTTPHFLPQKRVKTVTWGINGPPLYVRCAVAGATCGLPSNKSCSSSSRWRPISSIGREGFGWCSGTTRICSPG